MIHVDLACADVAQQINQQVQASVVASFSFTTPQHVSEQVAVPNTTISTTDDPNQCNKFNIYKETQRQTKGKCNFVNCISCSVYDKSYACSTNLRDHNGKHTGCCPFVCDGCGMRFAQRSRLRMHKRIHTGEKPYMCGLCCKTFSRSSHLPRHLRQHTGEKPYTCQDCNQTFTTNQGMKNHLRIHTGEKPYICNLCDAAFTHRSALSTHKKSHTGEKIYKCDICHKTFIFISGLKEHMIVHSQEKPFQCEQCHKRFKYSKYLSKHKTFFCGNDGYRKRWQKTDTIIKETKNSETTESLKCMLHQSKKNPNTDEESENLLIYKRSDVSEEEKEKEQPVLIKIFDYSRYCVNLIDNGDWKKAWIKQGYK